MAAPEVLGGRQHENLQVVRDIIDELDAEAGQRLWERTTGDLIPNSLRSPIEFDTFVAESLKFLAQQVRDNRRPGRPKKNA